MSTQCGRDNGIECSLFVALEFPLKSSKIMLSLFNDAFNVKNNNNQNLKLIIEPKLISKSTDQGPPEWHSGLRNCIAVLAVPPTHWCGWLTG
jgi:hypothetical protein